MDGDVPLQFAWLVLHDEEFGRELAPRITPDDFPQGALRGLTMLAKDQAERFGRPTTSQTLDAALEAGFPAEKYGTDALLARLDGRGRATVDALRGLLGATPSEEEPVRGATTPPLEIVAKELAELAEALRTAPDIEDRLALALSKQTGRPAEEIRKELS